MMGKYAYVQDGAVFELISTDLDINELFHPDFISSMIDVTALNAQPLVGWIATKSDGEWDFSAPVPPVPTDDELKAVALAQRDLLLAAANESTAGMADAFIAGLLSDVDIAAFKSFAAYKLALNKIDKQPGYPQAIDWPGFPA